MAYPSLPSAEDFYFTLKNENPINSEEDYQQLINIWNNEGMQTFKDYLIYYNNLDTGPCCVASENFCENVDIFKDYITLLGVAMKMIYQSSDSKFDLFNKDNADLYYTFKQNIVGGPSIIFSRFHEKDVTKINNQTNFVKR